VGKTAAAVRIAQALSAEIVSADARQCFRELSVGVARPSPEELGAVTHHLIGHRSVADDYNAARYAEDALRVIGKLFEGHEHLLLCGGSGLYIKAVLEGFDAMPAVPPEIRKQVEVAYREKGLSWLQREVALADPDYYRSADTLNPRRLARALEIFRATGLRASELRKGVRRDHPFRVVKIALDRPRPELHQRIGARVEAMMQSGLLAEVEGLKPMRHLPALRTVGYSELFDYLDGSVSLAEAKVRIVQNTRKYARRQLTWFRKDSEYKWFHPDDLSSILEWIHRPGT
jgi:tRNA dimethylallyltransferase